LKHYPKINNPSPSRVVQSISIVVTEVLVVVVVVVVIVVVVVVVVVVVIDRYRTIHLHCAVGHSSSKLNTNEIDVMNSSSELAIENNNN
jgi:hypothetical protein